MMLIAAQVKERVIKVKDLYKVIDGEVVLDHLNMQVEEGSIYGLIGPNGA